MVQRQAAMMSFNDIFGLMAILFAALIPLILLMQRPKTPDKQGRSHLGENSWIPKLIARFVVFRNHSHGYPGTESRNSGMDAGG